MDLFNLYARITMDTGDYEKGLNEAGKKTSSFSEKLKNGLATAAKIGGAAIGAAATAVAALTKNSIEQYGEYEQLVGGVETLFGKSADIVMGYAENAYKTAGMSANEYMKTVTGFSASLLQSLAGDTEEAARKADMAITDMSDNANKMGTDISMLQNAYQGFAKQNYTMLDNLKLGYGGTKEEMERLLEDASKLSGIKYDISSYADIVDAIHVVQTEMGITGTTAKEASTTIQGSVSAMKAAWSNLVVGIADDNADMDKLIGNFVDSIGTAGKNIIPRVEKILGGIGMLVEKLAPIIAKEVPNVVTNVLPSFISAGIESIQGIIGGIVSALPTLASSAVDILIALATSILENLPMLFDSAAQIIQTLVEQIANSLPDFLKTGANVLESLVSGIEDGIPGMIDRLPKVIDGILNFITENLPKILEKGVELLNRLSTGIIQAIPQLVSKLPQIIRSFVAFISANLPAIVKAGLEILLNLTKGIIDAIPELVASLPELIFAIVDGIGTLLGSIWDIGVDIVNSIADGIAYAWNSLVGWFNDLWNSLFGNRNVNINVNQTTSGGVNGSHASGLSYVPFDGYIAELHRGERVLTAREASQYRGNTQDDRPINITVQSVLDGRVIGETAYTYNRRRERAKGT